MANKDEMIYNGTTLEWAGHGIYKATSGVGDFQKPDSETEKGKGPVPEGEYNVSLRLGGYAYVIDVKPLLNVEFDKEFSIENMPTNFEFGDLTPRGITNTPAWGCHRVRLQKVRFKNPKCEGRDGFYIHDSTKGYSAGCIETESLFFEQLIPFAQLQQRKAGVKTLRLIVDYSAQRKLGDKATTYGGTKEQLWSPKEIPGNVDTSY